MQLLLAMAITNQRTAWRLGDVQTFACGSSFALPSTIERYAGSPARVLGGIAQSRRATR